MNFYIRQLKTSVLTGNIQFLLLEKHKTERINLQKKCTYPTNYLTNYPNTGSRVLLQKLTASQLTKEFLAFYEIQCLIAVFTKARHFCAFSIRRIQSNLPHSISLNAAVMLFFLSTSRSQPVSFLQVSPPKRCMHCCTSPCRRMNSSNIKNWMLQISIAFILNIPNVLSI